MAVTPMAAVVAVTSGSAILDLASPSVIVLALAVLAVVLIRWSFQGGSDQGVASLAMPMSPSFSESIASRVSEHGAFSSTPRLEGVISPGGTEVMYSNSSEPYVFSNDNCDGKVLFLHRPTHDKTLEKSGNYPFSDHFKGRKRLWECRIQFRFKRVVNDPLLFGIELDEYVPLNAASKKLMGLTVAALRHAAGKDLYHSPGDDPRTVTGPLEKPVFTMPLWAFDQLIETPEGEDGPSLCDPHFSSFGSKRADDRSAFIEEISALKLRPGPTFTFSFWGISQFLDDINWEITKVIPFSKIDFNKFCGAPPVHYVLYTLKDDEDARGESRHLQSRKDYFFKLSFWSSKKPPCRTRLMEVIPPEALRGRPETEEVKRRKGWAGLFACCAPSQRSS